MSALCVFFWNHRIPQELKHDPMGPVDPSCIKGQCSGPLMFVQMIVYRKIGMGLFCGCEPSCIRTASFKLWFTSIPHFTQKASPVSCLVRVTGFHADWVPEFCVRRQEPSIQIGHTLTLAKENTWAVFAGAAALQSYWWDAVCTFAGVSMDMMEISQQKTNMQCHCHCVRKENTFTVCSSLHGGMRSIAIPKAGRWAWAGTQMQTKSQNWWHHTLENCWT